MSSQDFTGANGAATPVVVPLPNSDKDDQTPATVAPPPPQPIQATKDTREQPQADSSTTTKQPKSPKLPVQSSNTEDKPSASEASVKLTGAQLKKQKAAEKAARRAEKVAAKGDVAQVESVHVPQVTGKGASQQKSGSDQKDGDVLQLPTTNHHHQRRKSSAQPLEPGAVRLPLRAVQQTANTTTDPAAAIPSKSKPNEKRVPMVSHLYPSTRSSSLASASREIHPGVITLALHLRSLALAGSTARTLALLITLKRVIRAYSTPPNTALSRHLTTHLSHQISFISAARPLGIAQGNAIRWLKTLISKIDPDLDENDAKKDICDAIDSFIIERVTYASDLVASQATIRIAATDETILVYAKSSVVEKTLLKAAREQGKRFKVVIVDSRPLFEGRNLAKSLLRAGMREGGDLEGCEVVYTLLSGLADVLEQHSVTKCFLGASAMLGNGSLYSRSGSAMVATMAKYYKVPVIVLAESIKFTAKIAVDCISLNEVGDADALVDRERRTVFVDTTPLKIDEAAKKGGGGGGGGKKKGGGDDDSKESKDDDLIDTSILGGWQDQPNLYLLNLMYDTTPKEYLDMIICELGTLPPGAVPVVNGVHGGEE